MKNIITKITSEFPNLNYKVGSQFCWSPETNEIFYKKDAMGNRAVWSLLHETGHALLKHKTYKSDFELLRLEIEAWEKARYLSSKLKIVIDEEHIQDCLDTYRDWLYKRSICPTCTTKCLQQGDFVHYRCFNCHTKWRVTSSLFCRSYRSTKGVSQVPVFRLQTDLQ